MTDDILGQYIGLNPVEGSAWIRCDASQPGKRGKYMVITQRRGGFLMNCYYWNGGYWVTNGNSPTQAVVAWLDESGRHTT